jgi:hypothetical protein
MGKAKSMTVDTQDRLHRLEEDVKQLREVLQEVALPPYTDSDLESLLTTLRVRAEGVLRSTEHD